MSPPNRPPNHPLLKKDEINVPMALSVFRDGVERGREREREKENYEVIYLFIEGL